MHTSLSRTHSYVLTMSLYFTSGNITDLNRIEAGPSPSAPTRWRKPNNKPNGWPMGWWWMISFEKKKRWKKTHHSQSSLASLASAWGLLETPLIHWFPGYGDRRKLWNCFTWDCKMPQQTRIFEMTSRSDLEDYVQIYNVLLLSFLSSLLIPVVPHKAVAEVSKIGNL